MTEPPQKKPKVGVLNGLALCVSGNLTVTRKVFESFLVEHGATLTMGATKTTAYLVCTFSELSGQTLKVQQAAKNGVPCVSEQYVREAVANGHFPSDLTSDPIYAASRAADGGMALGSAATSVIAVQAASSVAAARNVMLAKAWDDTMDPTGWWISEKVKKSFKSSNKMLGAAFASDHCCIRECWPFNYSSFVDITGEYF